MAGRAAKQIDMVKFQQGIDHLEKNKEYTNQNAVFEDLSKSKWGIKEGLSPSFLYHRYTQSLQTDNPIRMKTKPGRVRKPKDDTSLPLPPPKAVEIPQDLQEAFEFSFAAPPRKLGETAEQEVARLREAYEYINRRHAVYLIDDSRGIMNVNPASPVKCAGNGHATKANLCPEADEPYEVMLDGLRAAQKVVHTYKAYVVDHALNPEDRIRISQACNVLAAFFNASRLSLLREKSSD
jgi:hypothetical protein